MHSELQHFGVNWKDGMNVSAKDFHQLGNFIQDINRDTSAINLQEYNYGILPCEKSSQLSFYPFYDIISLPDSYKIVLKTCRGITLDGYRLELTENVINRLKLNEDQLPSGMVKKDNGIYDIVLSLNPFIEDENLKEVNRQEAGLIRSNYISRLNVIPSLQLEIVQTDSYKTSYDGNQLCVGRIKIDSNGCKRDENYIPPCRSVSCHSDLSAYLEDLKTDIAEIKEKCITILNKPKDNIDNKSYANNAKIIAEKLLFYLGTESAFIKFYTINTPPINLFAFHFNLAKIVFYSFLPMSNKEAFVQEYTSNCKSESGKNWGQLLTEIWDHQPNYINIHPSMNLMNEFRSALKCFINNLANARFEKPVNPISDREEQKSWWKRLF